jgi:hypothetical protein
VEIRTLGPLVAICLTGCLGLDGSSGGDATASGDAGSAADGGGAAGDAAGASTPDADAAAPDASTPAPDAAALPLPDIGTPPAADAGAAPAPDAAPPCDPATWYPDVDGDGLGDERAPISLCEAPDGYVDNGDDLEPECATNDTDDCGLCGGPGPAARYADGDGDGLGDPAVEIELCGDVDGFVENADDPEPACETNDTDSCGICAGEDEALDCVGVCFGLAIVDGCGQCAGGTTGIAPATRDSDEDGQPDACDQCPIGDQPRFIVQWDQVVGFAGGGPYTFQVVLYGNGDVSFRYEVIEPFDAQATVGHQGPAGQNPTSLGFNSEFPRNHREVYFYRREDGRLEVDYSIPVPFIDIGWSGEDLDLGDDEEVRVPVGFEFPFNAGAYADVMISSNGFIGLGGGAVPSYNNVSLPAPELSGIIAPLWDDLNPTRGQGRVLVYTADNNCAQDCAGDFGGVAFEDNCGICSGGSTAREPDSSIDCNGVCGGEAYRDICGECVGGNTGLEPSDPAACPQGPDLIVDQSYLSETLELRRQNRAEAAQLRDPHRQHRQPGPAARGPSGGEPRLDLGRVPRTLPLRSLRRLRPAEPRDRRGPAHRGEERVRGHRHRGLGSRDRGERVRGLQRQQPGDHGRVPGHLLPEPALPVGGRHGCAGRALRADRDHQPRPRDHGAGLREQRGDGPLRARG